MSIGHLTQQFVATLGIIRCAFSLLYIGLCRVLGLVVTGRRSGFDKDVEIVVLRYQVRCVSSNVSSMLGCGTGPQMERSLPR